MQPAGDIVGASDLELGDRLIAASPANQRLFKLALVGAFLLHAAIFIEVGRSIPRTVGDKSGASDAIAVDLVTEADLKSMESVALPKAGAPPKPTPKPEPQPEPDAKEAEPTPKQAEPKEEPVPPAPTPPAEKQPEKVEKPAEKDASKIPDFQSALPDLASTPLPSDEPAQKQAEPQKAEPKKVEPEKPAEKQPSQQPAKKKAQQQARLEPTPKDFMNAPPGRSAGASRPPGITRSGENDDFGRIVIRALRQTMPPPRGIFGRVTVRLILSENGDLKSVEVLERSGTQLDQDVAFATRQTYFPLPPYNSTVVDRTFLITYVYR